RFAKTLLTERFAVPVICGHEVADELNMIERGTTALLNARLLPLVSGFMNAVEDALAARGVRVPVMIVRSDGSLMSEELGWIRPVETILSGPAASALGGTGLAGKQGRDCLVIDMGGTTTDISITREGVPTLSTTGIRIAGWRTQVKGVSVETYALGGDSVLRLVDGRLMLAAQRVLPMCVAASRWPVVREALRGVLATARRHSLPLHEFLSLVHKPADSGRFTVRENALVKTLVDGPLNVEAAATAVGTDIYQLGSERLEAEGIILRCGLTPTDLMHIRGDFTAYDTEAAVLVARCLLRCQVRLADDDEGLQTLAEEGYDLMKRTLYAHVVRTVLAAEHPGLFADGPDAQLDFLISQAWGQWREGMPTSFIDILPHIGATLVGIGAPIHIFLPEVAEALGARCVIPEHSEAANALGAVISSISATAKVEISSYSAEDGQGGYRIHGPQGTERYDTLEIAIAAAESAAAQAAEAEARRRGATGFLTVETEVDPQSISDSEGRTTIFGFTVHAVASPVQGVDADIAGLPRHRFTYPTRTSSG
ncbi:MAG: hypothetical protein LBI64_00445, partial [Coriobacteriales bacterium]|nr:hypothetical protein [Coriobacteriales bacterium]